MHFFFFSQNETGSSRFDLNEIANHSWNAPEKWEFRRSIQKWELAKKIYYVRLEHKNSIYCGIIAKLIFTWLWNNCFANNYKRDVRRLAIRYRICRSNGEKRRTRRNCTSCHLPRWHTTPRWYRWLIAADKEILRANPEIRRGKWWRAARDGGVKRTCALARGLSACKDNLPWIIARLVDFSSTRILHQQAGRISKFLSLDMQFFFQIRISSNIAGTSLSDLLFPFFPVFSFTKASRYLLRVAQTKRNLVNFFRVDTRKHNKLHQSLE